MATKRLASGVGPRYNEEGIPGELVFWNVEALKEDRLLFFDRVMGQCVGKRRSFVCGGFTAEKASPTGHGEGGGKGVLTGSFIVSAGIFKFPDCAFTDHLGETCPFVRL